MFVPMTSSLMIAFLLIAQNPLPGSPATPPAGQNTPTAAQQNPAPAAGQSPLPAASSAITVPAGTSIPLTLMNAIKSKATKPGDTVRAVVAFPVTVGSRLAIPAGTFAEGTVSQVSARPLTSHAPTVRIHFMRLVFANGYSASLDAENTQSFLLRDEDKNSTVEVAELTPPNLPGAHFAMGEGQQPTLPPLPQVGPNPAVIGGIAGGVTAALVVGLAIWSHHRVNNYDFVVFDVGWQFQMVLDSPVVLDATQVAAATAAPSMN